VTLSNRLLSTALLLAVGFALASLLGPPELADRLAASFHRGASDPGELSPLSPEEAARIGPTRDFDAWRTTTAPAAPPTTLPARAPAEFEPGRLQPVAPVPRHEPQDTFTAVAPPAATELDNRRPPVEITSWETDEASQKAGDRFASADAVWDAWSPPPEPAPSAKDWFAGKAPIAADQSAAAQHDSAPRAVNELEPISAPSWRSAQAAASLASVGVGDKHSNLIHGPMTTHVVTDGDTLPKLAERYLGDAAQAQRLFDLNGDVLDHPDLLPIGAELSVPASPPRSERATASAQPKSGLAPVADVPQREADAPRATLSAPQTPADLAGWEW